jgi:AcrR family transcriptional regulator
MSRNQHARKGASRPAKRKTDQRIVRTRDRLGDAIIQLIQEKPFDSVTVQDVLDRAGVGRSTFYVHYSDKDDLFISDVEEGLGMMATALSRNKDKSDRVFPVREFFVHVADVKRFYAALVESGKINDIWELAQGLFARGIAERLAEIPRARGLDPARRAALGQAHAGALLSLLKWWLDQSKRESPEHMDELYHSMVWSGVNAGASQTTPAASSSAMRKRM